MVTPIINMVATETKIASKILKLPAICSSTFTIFSSAITSHTAVAKWYDIVSTASFIIGIMHMPITIITPNYSYCIFQNIGTTEVLYLRRLLVFFLQLVQSLTPPLL